MPHGTAFILAMTNPNHSVPPPHQNLWPACQIQARQLQKLPQEVTMSRLIALFALGFSACATPAEPAFVFTAQATPPHADQVHCDTSATFAAVVARHHVKPDETRDLGEDVSKATDLMSRHPGLLADILAVSRCDTATPTPFDSILEQLSLSYAAVLAASATPTVDAGRSLWLLGEQLRAGSLMHSLTGANIQEEALRRVLGPALAALPADARAAAIADLRTPPSAAALADDEQALVTQLPLPLPGGRGLTNGSWFDELRCRAKLPDLLGDLRGLDALPPAERAAAWAAQHEDHAACAPYDEPIGRALERDLALMRALEEV